VPREVRYAVSVRQINGQIGPQLPLPGRFVLANRQHPVSDVFRAGRQNDLRFGSLVDPIPRDEGLEGRSLFSSETLAVAS
jgi:hypothetical protein